MMEFGGCGAACDGRRGGGSGMAVSRWEPGWLLDVDWWWMGARW